MGRELLQGRPQPGLHAHETTDVGPRRLIFFLIGLIISAVVVYMLVGAYHRHIGETEASEGTMLPYDNGPRELPPSPRLQVTPYLDWEKYREDDTKKLSGYGWVNQQSGTARIPIDRAMDLLAQRGLPARQSDPAKTIPREQQVQPDIRVRNPNEPVLH